MPPLLAQWTRVLWMSPPAIGVSRQVEATTQALSTGKIVSTDPPYYDNICYADLSDFFYVWLRRSLRSVFPDLFATLATPKADELVATRYRHGSKDAAEEFFMDGMTQGDATARRASTPRFSRYHLLCLQAGGKKSQRGHNFHWLGDLFRSCSSSRLSAFRHMADAY